MCIFAKYKNIFGEPRKGVHSYRLFDFAIIDFIFTIIPIYIIGLYYNYNLFSPVWQVCALNRTRTCNQFLKRELLPAC